MSWLIDSHVFLWLDSEVQRFSAPFLTSLKEQAELPYFSAASAWELAIKASIKKLELPMPPHDYFADVLQRSGFRELPVRISHAAHAAVLPPVHKDPFDRILAAQAQLERLTVVTVDPIFQAYGCLTLDPTK